MPHVIYMDMVILHMDISIFYWNENIIVSDIPEAARAKH